VFRREEDKGTKEIRKRNERKDDEKHKLKRWEGNTGGRRDGGKGSKGKRKEEKDEG
jgi:hypothetical protein